MDMKTVLNDILTAYGLLLDFDAASDGTLWSIEIRPKEGATAYSRPLIIAREGPVLRLAHYTVSTYDIDYDPFVEFDMSSSDWPVISIYRFHTGYQCFDPNGAEQDEARAFIKEWAEGLVERGYCDASHGVVVGMGRGKAKL
ncbi:uncharacterized protein SPPG_07335 [Spizellomyces punctatus DAOM BR117]|uniref:Uncharacterized protein n=1 Tax=Spizellomyces punctatus (strain DAOM BR117) TaxID=645134 RepID=A0A0L0H8T2_SPIPD|nr:uncharacterized protein SPPG_07335 [Spizellomyces punctatus DAOM BR117]KNC97411.1 hypothetical protein SPPG_07335 [Spizellomyces punctatus DAOM BR117]|eukprot:XP_016605451.1 hypothetical protein SPPG_07335 [Spizellomyces punctatus DAOM BR117]